MNRVSSRQRLELAALVVSACALASCAIQDDTSGPPSLPPASAGPTASAGASAGVGGNSGATSAGAGGSSAGASAGGGSAGASAAGAGGGSSAGGAGTSGANGNGGNAGSAGSGGSAGGVVADRLLSQGKPATADSEEGNGEHPASHGNDPSGTTRWCAANSGNGHYWQVDLQASYTLGKLDLRLEKAAAYRFKVEGSLNGNDWTSLLDRTNSNDTEADRSFTLESSPRAQWVRITFTGLPNTTTWASFFDLSIYGQ